MTSGFILIVQHIGKWIISDHNGSTQRNLTQPQLRPRVCGSQTSVDCTEVRKETCELAWMKVRSWEGARIVMCGCLGLTGLPHMKISYPQI